MMDVFLAGRYEQRHGSCDSVFRVRDDANTLEIEPLPYSLEEMLYRPVGAALTAGPTYPVGRVKGRSRHRTKNYTAPRTNKSPKWHTPAQPCQSSMVA
jgi:hypothetical protein